MNKTAWYSSIIIVAVSFTACDDIFEKDISAEVPEIITPADGQKSQRHRSSILVELYERR